MLEAKIVEVTLSSAYQAGINWAGFFNDRLSVGQACPGTVLQPGRGDRRLQATGAGTISSDGTNVTVTNAALTPSPARDLANLNPTGAVFGLALADAQLRRAAAVPREPGQRAGAFQPAHRDAQQPEGGAQGGHRRVLRHQRKHHVPPRAAPPPQQSPTVTVQPFFSGIVLDVTPQIDDNSNIILHIHPSVSEVTESTRVVNLGGQIAEIRLPLAKSTVSETDTVVRVTDGNIVAIGGLMSVDIRDNRGGIPGVGDDGPGSCCATPTSPSRKKELVILLKPTLIAVGPRLGAGRARDTEESEIMRGPLR